MSNFTKKLKIFILLILTLQLNSFPLNPSLILGILTNIEKYFNKFNYKDYERLLIRTKWSHNYRIKSIYFSTLKNHQ
jgi:hypothetical protein